MIDKDTRHARAIVAFLRRDALERELREIDATLQALRSEHMKDTRRWGLRMEAFRQEIFTIKVAA